MEMHTEVPPQLVALVSRAASIELRFSTEAKSTDTLSIYTDMVQGLGKPISTKPPVSLRLGQEQELRFVVAAAYTNCTVIYWSVVDNSSKGISEACAALESKGCTVVEKIHIRPDQPTTECCLLQDPAGNLFGVIINPPYPLL